MLQKNVSRTERFNRINTIVYKRACYAWANNSTSRWYEVYNLKLTFIIFIVKVRCFILISSEIPTA
jgi:hypothetical protein